MKIILNADDLGASREVNDAVFALMATRRIASATLLANGPALADALRHMPEFTHCSFGVHLNLSEFEPVSGEPELRALLDQAGFAGNRVREVPLGRTLRAAIGEEWSAQITRLKSLGVRVSHIDSHHHVHTVPALFPVLKSVQRRFGIRKVRISMNLYAPDAQASATRLLAKAAWNFALRRWYATTTTERFTSFDVFCRTPKEDLRGCRSIELMVHPGSEPFADETRLLGSADWLRQLPFAAQCISYDEL